LHADIIAQLLQGPQPLLAYEGLNKTPWVLDRADLCHKLIQIVEKEKRLLVRGPFASGKTALVQLLHFHLSSANKTAYAISLSGSNGTWHEWWLKQLKVQWDTIAESKEPVFVLIDEMQLSYSATSNTHNLWECVKNAHTTATTLQKVHFICVGAYGWRDQTVTPDCFGDKAFVSLRSHNGTPGLAYTPDEFLALCKVFLSSFLFFS
jgi:hypothetical protein